MKRYWVMFAVTLSVLAVLLLRTPDTNPDDMREKYSNQYSGFISDDSGWNIHYRDQGNRDGTPIIFLHGSSGSLHVFESLLGHLSGDYRFVSYDHPGHGLTGPHPADDYTYAGYSQALDLVRAKLHVEQFILVGHSMGGWIAWRYATEHPEAVKALVIISASGMPAREDDPVMTPGLGEQLMQTSVGRWLSEHTMPRSMIKSATQVSMYDENLVTDQLVDQFWELMRFPGNRRAFSIRSQLGRDEHLAHLANSITAPTLIIWGDKDNRILPSSALSFRERIKQAEIVMLPNVGHLPMLEAPYDTRFAIEQFLGKLRGPK